MENVDYFLRKARQTCSPISFPRNPPASYQSQNLLILGDYQKISGRLGLPAPHNRRPDGEMPRAKLAARPSLAGDQAEQQTPIRGLRLQTNSRQAGGRDTPLRQSPLQYRHDGPAGARTHFRTRHRVNPFGGEVVIFFTAAPSAELGEIAIAKTHKLSEELIPCR